MSNKDYEDAQSGIEAAIEAGTMIGEPKIIGESGRLVGVLVPAGARLEQIDMQKFEDQYLDNPRRKTGTVSMVTAASFIAYVNAHKLASAAIYAKKSSTRFDAVFNDHEPEPRSTAIIEERELTDQERTQLPEGAKVQHVTLHMEPMGAPGWRDFGASYLCPQSVEWVRWMKNSQHAADGERKAVMTQQDFMQFMEDNLPDIIKPTSSHLLQAVHSFEAKKDVAFKSAMRLQDGSVTFAYTESINEVAQEGKLSLPEQFTILIPVFEGGTKYELDARLRYRVGNGGLKLWYELVRPHKVLEHAFNTVLDEVLKGVVDVPVYHV